MALNGAETAARTRGKNDFKRTSKGECDGMLNRKRDGKLNRKRGGKHDDEGEGKRDPECDRKRHRE